MKNDGDARMMTTASREKCRNLVKSDEMKQKKKFFFFFSQGDKKFERNLECWTIKSNASIELPFKFDFHRLVIYLADWQIILSIFMLIKIKFKEVRKFFKFCFKKKKKIYFVSLSRTTEIQP